MARITKPKCININFNFSDDSDDDKDDNSFNFQTQHVLKELKAELNCTDNLTMYHVTADRTIVSSDALSTSELPSLCEDIGPPVTESTWLDSSDTEPTLYLTTMGDNLNQSKLYHSITTENKGCHAAGDQNTCKPYTTTSKNLTVPKGKKHSEVGKENVCLFADKAKKISRASKSSHKPVTNRHKNDLEWDNMQETSLRGHKLFTKHKLYEGIACFTPLSVEYNQSNIKSKPLPSEELSLRPVQLETISDSADAKASCKHYESFSDSFVEVQDVSIQTSLIDVLQESKQDSDYELHKAASASEDVISPYLPALKSSSQSSCSNECENSSGCFTETGVIQDDIPPLELSSVQDDGPPLELSSYEVQDRSVQTSLIEALVPDCELARVDNVHNMSSVVHECTEEQDVCSLEKLLMKTHLENDQEESYRVKVTLINGDGGGSSKNNSDNETEISAKKHFETAYEYTNENFNAGICSTPLRYREVNGVKGSLKTEQSTLSKKSCHNDNESQACVSGSPALESNISEQIFGTYQRRKFNLTSSQRKASVNDCVGLEAVNKDLLSDVFDAEEKSGILAAASESEDEDNGHGEYAIDKIDESDLGKLDTDEDDDVEQCDGICDQSSHHADSMEEEAISIELNTAAAGHSHTERTIASNSTRDHEDTAIGTVMEAASSAKNRHAHREDFGATHCTKYQKSVNFNSTSRRKDPESSDDDNDFENFLSKLKNASKPQKPVSESRPLSEFIVEDEDDSSGAEDTNDDDEVFYIKTDNELNGGNRYPSRYRETVYTHYSCDDSDSADSGSDLDDFIVDTPSRKKGVKSKSTIPALELSSDDDFLIDEKPSNKSKARMLSKWQDTKIDVSKTCGDDAGKLEPEQSSGVFKTPAKNTGLSSKQKTQTASCEGIEDFPSRGPEKTPFKTPRNVDQWKRPFETPARLHIKEDNFKMPSNMKGFGLQCTTAPRPSGCTGLNDDAFFLKSLNADVPDYKRHADAVRFIKRFKQTKAELAQRLFKIFNNTVFDDKLPKDFVIEWSARYTSTAGTFNYKRTPSFNTSKIILSAKVCDSPERVRDTLAHELCHAAVKLINDVSESHGRFWKSWARKTNRTFPFMPVIARCHNYFIAKKYTYRCVNCKYRVYRHSKSLDTDRNMCGHCHGKFELYLTSELNSNNESCKTPLTSRTPNKFALFVKECYSEVKKRDRNQRHGDVMKILSQEFAEKNKICD